MLGLSEAKVAIDGLTLRDSLLKADELEAKENGRGSGRLLRGSVNRLQSVGAFTPPAQVEMLDVAKKSERHLAGIHKGITAINNHMKAGAGDGVTF